MLDESEFNDLREAHQVDEEWRNISYYVIADLLEVCSTCGMVAEKERLICCPSCEDTYCCREGRCFNKHRLTRHTTIAYWSR